MINLCGKNQIRKSSHYGGQAMQTNRAIFLVMTKGSDYLLLLDKKSQQRYKLKINNIQGYDLYQIKKKELSGNISKSPPVQQHSLL